MPKRQSDVWDQYQVIGGAGNTKHVICVHCNTEYRHSHATRMQLHLIKCKKCPSDIKNKLIKKVSSKTLPNEISTNNSNTNTRILQNSSEQSPRPSTSFSSDSNHQNLISCDDDDNSQLSPDHTLQTINLRNQIETVDTSGLSSIKKDEINTNIARAIYASGTPLSLLESKHWKKALASLNPDYEPPTRHCLSNRLLDADYSRVKSDITDKIRTSKAVAIITDGWTNINGKGVINFIIITPEPIFYKSVYPECEKETGEYLSSEIIKVIEDVGPAKVVALITDNAKNMKAAWRLVQNKYPNIACIGCVAHSLNLIYSDIAKLPTLKDAIDIVTKIIKFITNKNRALAYFEKIQYTLYGNLKQSLKLPCKTRWNTVVVSLDSFVRNKEALKALAVSEEIEINSDILTILINDQIWATIDNILKVLKPISNAITKLESDKARISDVPIEFIKLEAAVEDELTTSIFQDHETEIIRQAIKKRRDFCVQPIHLASNMLDPRYRGSGLTSDQEADASNYIHDHARFLGKDSVAVMTNFAEFRTKSAYFEKCHSAWITIGTVAPYLWWQSFASKQELFPIAFRLLNVPPSSAAAERNWSLFANTHTKLRNRLQTERVHKLITVRQNLRYLDDDMEEEQGSEDENAELLEMEIETEEEESTQEQED